MKSKKGFTLIELLAVIVILAIIALIAVPIILDVIETSKKGAKESSVLGYIDAVEKQIAINVLDKNKNNIDDGVYTVSDLETTYNVLVKGEKPSEGWVKIQGKRVASYSLKIDEYIIEPNSEGKAQVTDKENLSEMPSGAGGPTKELAQSTTSFIAKIYLDPTDLSKTCTKNDVYPTLIEKTAIDSYNDKTGCMRWFAFKDDGTNYHMILDHLTTPTIAFNSANNLTIMNEAKTALNNDSSSWQIKARLLSLPEFNDIIASKDNATTVLADSCEQEFATQFGVWNDFECKSQTMSKYWVTTETDAGNGTYTYSDTKCIDNGMVTNVAANSATCGIRPVIVVPKSIIK